MDDPRLIPRLTPHGRLLLRASDEGPELEPALAERLTGWIQVDSKLGRGSTFSFSQARARAAAGTQGPGVEVDVARADEAYDLLDRRPQEAVQVMLTYRA